PRDATALTKTGLILGTERFAAPEVMQGEAATEQSDLYSCGVVLRSCGGPFSRELEGLIERLTEADPRSRPSSARQALAALDRVEPTFEPTTQAFEPEPEPTPDRNATAPPLPPPHRGSRHGRWGAVAALGAFVVALLVVALVALGGGDDQKPARRGQEAGGVKPQPQEQQQAQAQEQAQEPSPTTEGTTAESTTAATPEPAPEESEPSGGSSLNEQGFELIQAGEYEAAVPVLEEAVDSFPEGSEDLAYAYALFNLGNALRLSGRPEEAIPVLERRLEIPNQTSTVEEELEAARSEAG
ncbi:MAG TPA: tetratricopeptide repeat-containing protein kinase family protein, partial [Solirubrobacterales bacterium]|nr:tetratricopeptide repeat-containing protein kinase family protein [Solirubrobacterales bacterium]